MNQIQDWAQRMKQSVTQVVLGKEEVLEKVLATLLCGGHILLEDMPGVGKTLLARAISSSLGGKFQRIQCTPDLLPSDILGVSVYIPSLKRFRFHPGPIVSHILLVDEINRATPRSQSALLEAMESSRITQEGKSTDLPDPFFMIATENPLEFEGTFPLPEAQKDRFFMTLSMGYPPRESELQLMDPQGGGMPQLEKMEAVSTVEEVRELKALISQKTMPKETEEFILKLVQLTREDDRLLLGASPRASRALYLGTQALSLLRGVQHPGTEMVRELALPILKKRIKIRTEALLNGLNEEKILEDIFNKALSQEES